MTLYFIYKRKILKSKQKEETFKKVSAIFSFSAICLTYDLEHDTLLMLLQL